jgi:hypothetical protein
MPGHFGSSTDLLLVKVVSQTDAQSQYGWWRRRRILQFFTTNVSTREQVYGGGGGGNVVDPGFQEALRQQAIQQQNPVYGDPDPQVDVAPQDRDSITSFLDNYAANVKANPFELGLIGALKTAYQTEQAKNMLLDTPGYEFLRDYSIANNTPTGGEGRNAMTNIISQAPYLISGSTPQQSMVNQYFANMGTMGQSSKF